jgi:hypothetical protein
VLGQARSLPLIGPIPIALAALLLLILIVLVFRPWIGEFQADTREIESGESVTLSWRASPFAGLYLDPGVGKLEGSEGSITLEPLENVTYVLRAENLLTNLSARWFGATAEIPIVVDPVLPQVKFSVDQTSVSNGDAVRVSWEIDRADEVILTVNGAPDTILPSEYIGNRQFILDRDTTFTIKAINRYTPPDGITDSKTVTVTTPTATPLPLPVIQRFDVTPLTITSGQSVTVSWAVTGARTVTIEGIGDVPDSGSISLKPEASTAYTLKASNGEADISSPLQQVIVNPAPTPTPLPGTPKIEFFIASPAEVAIGSPESKSVELSWSVTGDTTSIELNSPTLGKSTGLPAKGSQRVAVDKQTLFILTAFNTTLSSSSTVQVKVKNPAPRITSINPSSSTNVGGSAFTLVVSGSGFTKDSRVRWDGSNRATTFVSETQLTATILPDDIVKAGTFNVSVFNPTPGGGASSAAVFTLNNSRPGLTSINPISVVMGRPGLILTVNGSNFIGNGVSVVRFGGVDMATTFVNSTQLTAVIPAGQLGTAGRPPVTVFNPTPGGGSSDPIVFEIFASNPVPTINALTVSPPAQPGLVPDTVVAGGPGFNLTVNGTNFISGSLVRWNGVFLTTTVVNSTQLVAVVTASRINSSGSAKITPCPGRRHVDTGPGHYDYQPYPVTQPGRRLDSGRRDQRCDRDDKRRDSGGLQNDWPEREQQRGTVHGIFSRQLHHEHHFERPDNRHVRYRPVLCGGRHEDQLGDDHRAAADQPGQRQRDVELRRQQPVAGHHCPQPIECPGRQLRVPAGHHRHRLRHRRGAYLERGSPSFHPRQFHPDHHAGLDDRSGGLGHGNGGRDQWRPMLARPVHGDDGCAARHTVSLPHREPSDRQHEPERYRRGRNRHHQRQHELYHRHLHRRLRHRGDRHPDRHRRRKHSLYRVDGEWGHARHTRMHRGDHALFADPVDQRHGDGHLHPTLAPGPDHGRAWHRHPQPGRGHLFQRHLHE